MSENNGVPGWKSKILRDLVQVKGGRRLPKGHNFADGPTEYPYLRVTDFKNYSIDLSELKFLTNDDRELIKRYTISSDDVYISIAGTIGLVGTVPHELDGANLTENAAKLIINRDELDKDYLIYYLTSSKGRNEIETRIAKTSQPKLAISRIEQISLTYPSVSEQRAISRVLRAVQQAREARLREIALERERKAALMEHLFRHGTRGEATKETEIGEMPESWNFNSCEKLCEKITVGVVVRPSSYYVPSGVPAFRSFNIREDRIDPNDLVYFSHEANDTILSKSKIRTGDVLIVRTGYTGTASVVPKEFDGANCIDLVIARPNQSLIKGEYLSRYLNSSEGKRQALAAEIGLAQKHLNVGAVNRMQIPLPSKEEQHEIADLLNACDDKIAALEHEAHLHDELFRAMLEELMTGRLRAGALAENEAKNDLL